jgi:uncharacterized protein YfiM (DUF2279 family)
MKIRCSAIGKILTSPRTKGEVLSETAKTYIQDYFKEKELGIAKEFWSRYTDKGLQMEDEAIEFAGQVLGWEFVVKNTERYNNEWLTGEPDVITKDLLADIKCSWDGSTFPLFDTELKNKDYFWQLQGYMFLTGLDKAELVYCLMNTPHQIVEDEVRRAHWKAGLIDEDLDLREAVQSQHIFDHIPNNLRIKRFIVERDEQAIEQIKEKVELCRNYYEQLKSII